MILRKVLAFVAALTLAFAPALAFAAPTVFNPYGQPYTPLYGCDGVTPMSSGNPLCTSGAGGGGGSSGQSWPFNAALTVTASSYSAGYSEGGLQTITNAALTNGGTGTLANITLKSKGGATNTIWVYAFSKSPASTCTDHTAFSLSASDAPYMLPGFPQSVTLASPGSWDTASYGTISPTNGSQYVNQDGTPGKNIYLCFVTAGAVTPASTSDLALSAGGFQP